MKNPAANHAAEPVVIYDLQREERYLTEVGPILKPDPPNRMGARDERSRTASR